MKKLLLAIIFFVFSVTSVSADSGYIVKSFNSKIVLEKNTDLRITETISVDFIQPRHGIFRTIKNRQQSGIKTINTRISDIVVTDVSGRSILHKSTNKFSETEIKIGNPNTLIQGPQNYVISYTISNVLQRYDNYDEIYWNVVGSGWDVEIPETSISFSSEFADIQGAVCFTGVVGSTVSNCEVGYDENGLISYSHEPAGLGNDFTVAIILDKQNLLNYPGIFRKMSFFLSDYWSSILLLIPAIVMLVFWYKKGRDITFGEKVYFGEEKDLKFKPIFARQYLPTVYSPIQNLTPAQIGTLVDETVNLKDIIAEILELARLKKIDIKQVKKDYEIKILDRDSSDLADYQRYLLENLFPIGGEDVINTNSFEQIKFYKHLEVLKNKIYKSLTINNYFDSRPDRIRMYYFIVAGMLSSLIPMFIFTVKNTLNPMDIIFIVISALISFEFAYQMPRKTAKGYAIYRDILGLKNYLKIGKWRHDIYEKNLFIEEIIPIAISLGVINKISRQMKDLGISPSYIHTSNSFINLNNFEKSMTKAVMAGAPSSSSNSWSGGSGFSGGSSGGGFGGGGGGSW